MLTGKIAAVFDEEIILNIGEKDGVKEEDTFIVLEEPINIIDPDTQELLGILKRTMGKLKVLKVERKFSIAKPVNQIIRSFVIDINGKTVGITYFIIGQSVEKEIIN